VRKRGSEEERGKERERGKGGRERGEARRGRE
jgi:hypothetical protein